MNKRIGVLGGSGFIGKHVTRALIDNQYNVISTYNTTKPPKDLEKNYVRTDINNEYHVHKFLQGTNIVFYLLHSLEKENVAKYELEAANIAGKAMKENNVEKVYFLGGPSAKSKHLKSRDAVHKELQKHVNTTLIRCSAVLGKESKSYKLINAAGHSFFSIKNKALQKKSNPILIDDLTQALVNLLKQDELPTTIEIGGQPITFQEMMQTYKEDFNIKKAPFAIPMSLTNPLVIGHLSFWGNVDYTLASHLLEGLQYDLELKNNITHQLLKRQPISFTQSIKLIENY